MESKLRFGLLGSDCGAGLSANGILDAARHANRNATRMLYVFECCLRSHKDTRRMLLLRGGVDEQRDFRQCYAMSGLPSINEPSEIFCCETSQVQEINRTALSVIVHRYL